MAEDRLINAQEVAYRAGISMQTLGLWYRFKRENPDSEYALMLPEFVRGDNRRTRFWHESDVEALVKFKGTIPIGRNGVLGSVTQRYVKKTGNKPGLTSYIAQIRRIMNMNDVPAEVVEAVERILRADAVRRGADETV